MIRDTSIALGMVVKDRWDLTKQTLESIYLSGQPKATFDLILIDNGSSPENVNRIKEYVKSALLPIKNLICLKEPHSIPLAKNLFLSLSRNYEYRALIDNDLVIGGTMTVPVEKKVNRSPGDYGTNPGSIKSGPPIRGIGMARTAKQRRTGAKSNGSLFLDCMVDFVKQNKVDMISLVTLNSGEAFFPAYSASLNKKWNGLPYLSSGCTMWTKKCFDLLGYLREDMPRRSQIEYSQRAMRNGLNVSYHPFSYVVHAGQATPASPEVVVSSQNQEAISAEKFTPVPTFSDSKWADSVFKIEASCLKSVILNLK